MTNVKMRAKDQLLISSVSSETLRPGEEFEVSGAKADELEAAGLATRVSEKKQAEAPANKQAEPPANKAGGPKRKKN